MKKIFLYTLSFFSLLEMKAQTVPIDTLKVMTYNVCNYGINYGSSCPLLLSQNKHVWLRTVINYAQPDILALEKMTAYPAWFANDTIPNRILDSVCLGCYGHTNFTNNSGFYKENMVYFKTSKLGYVGTTVIFSADTAISDITLHKFFYKTPDLATTHDTVFINVIQAHLLSGGSNDFIRNVEMTGAKAWLDAHITSAGNYIFLGDFNTKKSTEGCFDQLINSTNTNTKFYDPPNQLGNWGSNPASFAHYLTQSTRTVDPGDCGSVGGMDSRFDHILCTQPIILGTQNVRYMPTTFKVLGQDGLHVNASLIALPADTIVPSNVLNALYYMSNHLPVMLQLEISENVSGVNSFPVSAFAVSAFPNPATNELNISFSREGNYQISIVDVLGKEVLSETISSSSSSIYHPTSNIQHLLSGIYFITVSENGMVVGRAKFVKN